jgi:hypothetical protein
MLQLTTHAEKVQFLTNFLNEAVEGMTLSRPLMILGSGGNGKTHIIHLVAEVSPVNILMIHQGDGYRFLPSTQSSDKCAILLPVNGSPHEFALAAALDAQSVEFLKDPAFNVG